MIRPKTETGGGKGAQWAMKQQHSGWYSQNYYLAENCTLYVLWALWDLTSKVIPLS